MPRDPFFAHAGAIVADALAMPVHWYEDRAALDRDYGRLDRYLAPRNPHPDSILFGDRATPHPTRAATSSPACRTRPGRRPPSYPLKGTSMEMMTLKLHGRGADGVELYRSYYLVTDGGRMAGRGRASVIPMSVGAPMPERDYVEVDQGGEEHALMKLVNALLALPGNEGLVAELNDRPS